METTRNIIILNNLNSDDIEQAIIILKNHNKNNYSANAGIVSEAQKIIDDFILKNKRRSKRLNEIRSLLILIPTAAVIGLLMYTIFKFI